MQYAKYVLILVGLGFASVGHAQITAYSCNYCSDTQFEQLARTIGVGEHYLYDFNSDEIRLYEVESPPWSSRQTMAPPGGDLIVTRLSVPLAVQDTFGVTQQLWALNDDALGFFQIPVTLDPGDPDLPVRLRDSSAWDIASIESRQFDLQQYLMQEWDPQDGYLNQILNLARELAQKFATGTLAQMIFGSNPIAVTFVVSMPEGGTVKITYDHTHNSLFWYREGESRDSSSNLIPEQPSDMAWDVYEYISDPDAFDRWRNNPWGVPWPISYCSQVACVIVYEPTQTVGNALNSMTKNTQGKSTMVEPSISCSCAW